MILLNPKFLVLVALIVGGAYLATRGPGPGDVREWKVTHKADQVIQDKTRPVTDDAATRLRVSGEGQFSKDVVDNTAPPPPKEELTVDNLVKEVGRVSAMTPEYVPTVPLMGRLATAMVKEDPTFITFGHLAPGVAGEFRSGPNQPPKIVLSNDLKRLHEKGVPVAMIAPVLAHELDHFFWYMTRDISLARTHEVERQAMVSTAAYLEVMKRGGPKGYTGQAGGKKGDGEAVDARPEDEEVARYKRFLKKIRNSLFGGNVDGLVKEHYGTDKR